MNKNITNQKFNFRQFLSMVACAGILVFSSEMLSSCDSKPKEDATTMENTTGDEAGEMNASNGAEKVDAQADKVLKEMSEYLSGLQQFSYKSKGNFEVVDNNNKKELSYNAEVFVKRPNKLRVNVKNEKRDGSVFYDGKQFSVLGRNENMYAQAPAPPTLDAALDSAREKFLLDPPGSDILYSNPYKGWMEQVKQGEYKGEESVNGKSAHHLAFSTPEVDWEIWVQKGTEPLPLKYKIITKNEPEKPEFTVEFTDWKQGNGASFADQQFMFTPPAKAKKIPFMRLGDAPKTDAQKPTASNNKSPEKK